MADAINDVLGREAELVPGYGGIFVVTVSGSVVAKKTLENFGIAFKYNF